MCEHEDYETEVLEGWTEVWIRLTCNDCGKTIGHEMDTVSNLLWNKFQGDNKEMWEDYE
tara:strand:- start:369 stop:545 length:177 start_codon:yes stop_codon:yes gene_type:complete